MHVPCFEDFQARRCAAWSAFLGRRGRGSRSEVGPAKQGRWPAFFEHAGDTRVILVSGAGGGARSLASPLRVGARARCSSSFADRTVDSRSPCSPGAPLCFLTSRGGRVQQGQPRLGRWRSRVCSFATPQSVAPPLVASRGCRSCSFSVGVGSARRTGPLYVGTHFHQVRRAAETGGLGAPWTSGAQLAGVERDAAGVARRAASWRPVAVGRKGACRLFGRWSRLRRGGRCDDSSFQSFASKAARAQRGAAPQSPRARPLVQGW